MERDLLIYGVQGRIEQYVTPKKGKFDVRKAKGILPPDEARLHDHELHNPSAAGSDRSSLYNIYGDAIEEQKSGDEEDARVSVSEFTDDALL